MDWLWLILLSGVVGLETASFLNERDKLNPATYWIRRLLMLRNRWQPLYWIALGFWLWLGVHFFIDA